ncbi:MAG: disulfide oxidoreductase, partial [Alphaproteobacteria bacterium]
ALGVLPRHQVAPQLAALTEIDRRSLARLDVRLGALSLYLAELLKAPCRTLLRLLWLAHTTGPKTAPPLPTRLCFAVDPSTPEGYFAAVGYRVIEGLAVRVDMLERFAAEVRQHMRNQEETPPREGEEPEALPARLVTTLGVGVEEGLRLLAGLGYQARSTEKGIVIEKGKSRKAAAGTPRKKDRSVARKGRISQESDSPFAVLRSRVTPE